MIKQNECINGSQLAKMKKYIPACPCYKINKKQLV